jgi:hypothetical protein
MTKARMGCLATVALALGVSCGDGGGAGSADAFIASYCDLLSPCCSKAGLRSDGQQCRLFFGLVPKSSYDKQAGEACLAEERAKAGNPEFCQSNGGGGESPSCAKVFGEKAGSMKPGETCDSDNDCAASSEGKVACATAFSGGGQIRKCQVQVRGKAGDKPCVASVEGISRLFNTSVDDVPSKGYLCYDADNLRCDSTSSSCVPFNTAGETCTSSFNGECAAGTYCDDTTKKCTAQKALGAMCSDDGFSSHSQCAAGGYCKAPGVCTAQVADGGTCSSDNECKSNRCVNSKCGAMVGGDFGLALLCGEK